MKTWFLSFCTEIIASASAVERGTGYLSNICPPPGTSTQSTGSSWPSMNGTSNSRSTGSNWTVGFGRMRRAALHTDIHDEKLGLGPLAQQAQRGARHRIADQLLAMPLVHDHPVGRPLLVELDADAPGLAQLLPGVRSAGRSPA